MALVNCKECKKEVSNWAQECPHCGIKNPSLTTKEMFIGSVILILLVYGGVKVLFPKSDYKEPFFESGHTMQDADGACMKALTESYPDRSYTGLVKGSETYEGNYRAVIGATMILPNSEGINTTNLCYFNSKGDFESLVTRAEGGREVRIDDLLTEKFMPKKNK